MMHIAQHCSHKGAKRKQTEAWDGGVDADFTCSAAVDSARAMPSAWGGSRNYRPQPPQCAVDKNLVELHFRTRYGR